MKIGILTEKPSAAKNFAKAFGGMTGKMGDDSYIITCSVGHIFEFPEPAKMVPENLSARYKSWNTANLPWNENDFNWKRGLHKDKKDVFNKIKADLKGCAEIVIATDDDPTGEGELIAWEILMYVPHSGARITRMYFIDESEKELRKAFKKRVTIPDMASDRDYQKAEYRSRWDFLSMQFTRVATAFGDGKTVLRQGRLKSAMVALVGAQYEAINAYQKIPFYQNRFKDENGVVYTNKEEQTYPKPQDVPNIYKMSAVVCDKTERKSEAPPKLLDLAALSAALAEKGFKAEVVLATYQKMYQDQLVSYPRTEDKTITPEQFNELLPLVDQIASVVGVSPGLLTHRTPRTTHVKEGGAHGANRPGPRVPDDVAGLATTYGAAAPLIYTVVARNYLAMLAEDYLYDKHTGHVSDYPKFIGSCTTPVSLGYRQVFKLKDSDEDKDGESVNGLGKMAQPFVYEGFPPKPQTPTFKWLTKQLEKRDVGTGATRTSIYADVTSEASKAPLLKDTKGKITMTDAGTLSYKLLKGTHIGDLAITERLQREMRAVGEGTDDPRRLLAGVSYLVEEDIVTMSNNRKALIPELGPLKTSSQSSGSKGGADQTDRITGTWKGKEISFKAEWSGHKFTPEEVTALLNGDEIVIEAISSKTGNPFTCHGRLKEQEYMNKKFVGFKPDFNKK